jgi:hypothetical protein
MPIEIQVFLAKFLPDPRRGEPRNVGLVVRTAKDELLIRFLLEGEHTQVIPKGLDVKEFALEMGKWRETMEKYGVKALQWVGKRKKPSQRYYLEFAGGEMVADFDFDRLFRELVE